MNLTLPRFFWSEFRKRRKKASLITFALFWGTLSILLLMAFGQGMSTQFQDQLQRARRDADHDHRRPDVPGLRRASQRPGRSASIGRTSPISGTGFPRSCASSRNPITAGRFRPAARRSTGRSMARRPTSPSCGPKFPGWAAASSMPTMSPKAGRSPFSAGTWPGTSSGPLTPSGNRSSSTASPSPSSESCRRSSRIRCTRGPTPTRSTSRSRPSS